MMRPNTKTHVVRSDASAFLLALSLLDDDDAVAGASDIGALSAASFFSEFELSTSRGDCFADCFGRLVTALST